MFIDELKDTGNWKLCKEFVLVAKFDDVHWKEKGVIIINIDTISVITKTSIEIDNKKLDVYKLEMTSGNYHFVSFED
jgi:hypothetical protein